MAFQLHFTAEAAQKLRDLEGNPAQKKRLNAVRKCLGMLERNPRHPGLQAHMYVSMKGPGGVAVFEVYAESQTPAAYRVFFSYGPPPDGITILTITPHP